MAEIEEHKDKLGQIIRKGDFVAYPNHNSLNVGIVLKINPKMIKIRQIKQKTRFDPPEHNKYPIDCVKIEGPVVSMYMLTLT